jgi:hypothetical protein
MPTRYWIASISNVEGPPYQTFRRLVVDERIFAVLPDSRAATGLAPGDRICFYLKGAGIAGYADVASRPAIGIDSRIPNPKKYCSVFCLLKTVECSGPSFDFRDKERREGLDAFRGLHHRSWAWFVRTPHEITRHDFQILVGPQE